MMNGVVCIYIHVHVCLHISQVNIKGNIQTHFFSRQCENHFIENFLLIPYNLVVVKEEQNSCSST